MRGRACTHARVRARTHARGHTPVYNIYWFSTAKMIRERASMLRYTYIACVIIAIFVIVNLQIIFYTKFHVFFLINFQNPSFSSLLDKHCYEFGSYMHIFRKEVIFYFTFSNILWLKFINFPNYCYELIYDSKVSGASVGPAFHIRTPAIFLTLILGNYEVLQ
jgi:hypothetical protein